MSFYLSLFIFIISLVSGLILMIAFKGLQRDKFLLLSGIHGMFLLAFLASILLGKGEIRENYFFLFFVCSGLVMSGLSWRSDSPIILRYYFTAFAITLPMFLFSPSMLLNFLLSTHYRSSNEPVIPVLGRYFLEKQNVSRKVYGQTYYKLILKKGMFHQTIQRDLDFGGTLDSVNVIEYLERESMIIRGYTSIVTHVSTDVDSTDIPVTLSVHKPGAIEYHL